MAILQAKLLSKNIYVTHRHQTVEPFPGISAHYSGIFKISIAPPAWRITYDCAQTDGHELEGKIVLKTTSRHLALFARCKQYDERWTIKTGNLQTLLERVADLPTTTQEFTTF